MARKDFEARHAAPYVDATDREIDHLVYDLYGLTKEEIKIVEVAAIERNDFE